MNSQPQPDPALQWLESLPPEQRMTLFWLYMRAAELGAQVTGTQDEGKDEANLGSQADASPLQGEGVQQEGKA